MKGIYFLKCFLFEIYILYEKKIYIYISYWKLFGSPAFQFVYVIGLPVPIQKNLPSSPWSVPDVQKCSWPIPLKMKKIGLKKRTSQNPSSGSLGLIVLYSTILYTRSFRIRSKGPWVHRARQRSMYAQKYFVI